MKAEPCNLLFVPDFQYEYRRTERIPMRYGYSLYEPFDQDTRNYYSIWLMDPG